MNALEKRAVTKDLSVAAFQTKKDVKQGKKHHNSNSGDLSFIIFLSSHRQDRLMGYGLCVNNPSHLSHPCTMNTPLTWSLKFFKS